MAVTPQSNEAFLREVDEELRRDQMLSIWQRYGRWIIVAIVAALALLAAVLFWKHHREQVAGEQGEQFQRAFDDVGAGRLDKANPALATLADSKIDGYRAMARFTQADILLQKNDAKGAIAKLASIAGDDGLAKPFRDLALVRQTALEYDQLKPQVVIDRLRGLATSGSPWLGSAGEMVAVAYLRMGRKAMAGQVFGQIADDKTVPDSLRQRAVQMAGVLGVDAAKQNGTAR